MDEVAQGVNIFISNPGIVLISKYLLGPRRRGPRCTELINTGQRTGSTEAYTEGGGLSSPPGLVKSMVFRPQRVLSPPPPGKQKS